MSIVANILVALVAALHAGFLVLEMFLWTTPFGLKTFNMTAEVAASSAVLAANQGLYNGFLAAGLDLGADRQDQRDLHQGVLPRLRDRGGRVRGRHRQAVDPARAGPAGRPGAAGRMWCRAAHRDAGWVKRDEEPIHTAGVPVNPRRPNPRGRAVGDNPSTPAQRRGAVDALSDGAGRGLQGGGARSAGDPGKERQGRRWPRRPPCPETRPAAVERGCRVSLD